MSPAAPSHRSAVTLAAALALLVAASFAFRFLDWGSGPLRGLLLFEMLTAIVLLRPPSAPAAVGPRFALLVNALLAAAGALWLAAAVGAIANTARTGAIPLDQGQTTWRAARLLAHGENPYGFGALVDFQTYFDRLAAREAAGIGPSVPRADLRAALTAYDRTLSPADRAVVLPPAPASGSAALEAHLLGYKYGALFPIVALPLVEAGLPAGIMALNALVAVLCLAAVYRLMRDRVGDPALARLGLAALLCDNTILVNYVQKSATDVWALLLSALAALAVTRGRANLGAAALAAGFGFKIFPCALLFPMLVAGGRVAPGLVFAGVVAAIYAPFAVADPSGLLHNVFLWPLYLGTDTTSWLAFAPPAVGKIARVAGLVAIAWIWVRYLRGREPSLFRTLALVALTALATSGAFHNNYVPWASIWLVAALVELFGPSPRGATAAAPAERGLAAPASASISLS